MTDKPKAKGKKPGKASKAAKADKPAIHVGYPSKYDPRTVDAICERLARGEPLAHICRSEGMPNQRSVYRWMEVMPDVASRIARAREDGEDAIAADCLAIADDSREDFRMGERGTVVETDSVARAKLRVWTRLELLKKWNPRKWGDKQVLDHTSSDGSMSPLTPDQRALLDKTLDGAY